MNMSGIPLSLQSRFRLLHPLSHIGRHEVLHVQDETGQDWALKLTGKSDSQDTELSEVFAARANAGAAFVVPVESGDAGDGRTYQLLPYFPLGSLQNQLSVEPARSATHLQQCRVFVEQCNATLTALHARDDSSRFVIHGDIKPSNILLSRLADGTVRYYLSDLDSAVLLRGSESSARLRRYSPRYAAPEVIAGGDAGPSADFWSLGMIVLEWLTGSHPLADFPDTTVRRLVVTTRPNLDRVEGTEWRALLGGLLEASPDARWGGDQVGLWLQNDPATISAGLALCGEAFSEQPFEVGGTLVHTSRGLAAALLSQWATGVLNGEALRVWLNEGLGRGDLVSLLDGLMQDATLDDDLRLLHFAYSLFRNFDPIWRAMPLDSVQIEAMAQAAMAGDARALAWLRSLLAPNCHRFYEGRNAVAAVTAKRLLDAWEEYTQAWDTVIAQGVLAEARPGEDESLPVLARALFSDPIVSDLRNEIAASLEPTQLFRRASWYFAFGMDVTRLSVPQLLILRHLSHAAILEEEQHRITFNDMVGRDPNEFRGHSIYSALMDNLLANKRSEIKSGTKMIVLLPGQSHYSGPRGTLSETWDDLRDNVQDGLATAWNWFRRNVLARLGLPIPQPQPAFSAELRLFHLMQGGLMLGNEEREVLYAQLTWNAPQGLHVKVHVAKIEGLSRHECFVTRPLPDQATFHFPLVANSRIWLTARKPFSITKQSTRPMRVWFTAMPRLRDKVDELRHADKSGITQALDLRALSGKIAEVTDSIRKVDVDFKKLPQLASPSKPVRPRRYKRYRFFMQEDRHG